MQRLALLQRAARVAKELVVAAQRLRRREVAHAGRDGRVLLDLEREVEEPLVARRERLGSTEGREGEGRDEGGRGDARGETRGTREEGRGRRARRADGLQTNLVAKKEAHRLSQK